MFQVREPLHGLAFWTGLLLLLSAPIVRGGNRYVALVGLEWLALVVIASILAHRIWQHKGSSLQGWQDWALLGLVTAPVWVACIQLTPLPEGWWAHLPGRSGYAEALAALGLPVALSRPLSLTPEATWVSALAAWPLVAMFLLAQLASRQQLQTMCLAWVIAALAQGLLALAQTGNNVALIFGSEFGGSIGTFANSNHVASFMVMGIPLVAWRLHRLFKDLTVHRRPFDSAGWLWVVALVVLVAGVMATGSRGGVATALLAICLSAVLLWTPSGWAGGDRSRGFLAALVVLGASFLAVGAEWSRDFGSQILQRDSSFRAQVALSTWDAALEFWPVGSGLGSFASVYPRFQPASVLGFVEHAHSDYVQLLMELGILLPLLLVLLLPVAWVRVATVARYWLTGFRMRSEVSLRLAAAVGLVCLLLHAWVDFNLRIPALAMFGSFLTGVVLRREFTPEKSPIT